MSFLTTRDQAPGWFSRALRAVGAVAEDGGSLVPRRRGAGCGGVSGPLRGRGAGKGTADILPFALSLINTVVTPFGTKSRVYPQRTGSGSDACGQMCVVRFPAVVRCTEASQRPSGGESR